MKTNAGATDRVLRVVAGLIVLSLYFVLDGNSRYWAYVGLVPLMTGLVGYWPLYSLLGFNTCPARRVAQAARIGARRSVPQTRTPERGLCGPGDAA